MEKNNNYKKKDFDFFLVIQAKKKVKKNIEISSS